MSIKKATKKVKTNRGKKKNFEILKVNMLRGN
jgi:hypothetical protein